MPAFSKTIKAPMCERPLAPPPLSANPIFGRVGDDNFCAKTHEDTLQSIKNKYVILRMLICLILG
jgi:hypothetical protein